jgi:hypothetical protein
MSHLAEIILLLQEIYPYNSEGPVNSSFEMNHNEGILGTSAVSIIEGDDGEGNVVEHHDVKEKVKNRVSSKIIYYEVVIYTHIYL